MSAQPRTTLAGVVGRVMFVLLLTLTVMIGLVQTKGFPHWAKDEVLSHLNRGHHTLEAERLLFDPGRGWVLKSARWYVKGLVGPPMLSAEEVVVDIPLAVLFSKAKSIRKVTIVRGVFRPEMVSGPKPDQQELTSPWDASFDLQLWDMVYMGVQLEQVDCRVRGIGHKVHVERITARVGDVSKSSRYNLSGDAVYDRHDLVTEGKFDSNLDPDLLLPLLRQADMPFLQRLTESLEFGDQRPPKVSFAFTRDASGRATRASMDVSAQAWARDCTYRGVPLKRVDLETEVSITPTNCIVTLDPLYIVRPEGAATIGLTVNVSDGEIDFDGTSSLAPRKLARMIGVLTNAWTEKVLLEGACSIQAEGQIYLNEPQRNRITGTVEGDGIGYGKLFSKDYNFRIRNEGGTNHVEDVAATLCGGAVTGTAMVVAADFAGGPPHYAIRAALRDSDFERLVKSFGGENDDEYAGRLSLLLDMAGPIATNHAAEVHGSGSVKVEDGQIFRLPLFGGLSSLLTKIIPGLNFVLRQSAMDAEFIIGDGMLRTDSVAIDGGVLSLKGHGDYMFDGSLSFLVQVKLLKSGAFYSKLVRLVTWPLSKLLEFRLRGTLDEPNWYPVNFSRELLSKVGLNFGDDDNDETDSPDPVAGAEGTE